MNGSETENDSAIIELVTTATETAIRGVADTSSDCRTFVFVLYTVVMSSVCTCGLIGNTVSLIVLNRDHTSPVASFLLQSLAVADNTLLVTWTFLYSLRELVTYAGLTAVQSHPIWLYLRLYTFPVMFMAQTATIWLTVVLAINRFIAVCQPYSSPRLCKLAYVRREVAAVVIFAVLYNAPRLFERRINHHVTENSTLWSWTMTSLGNDRLYGRIYGDIAYYVFSFALPLFILGIINTRIIIAYRATRKRKLSITSRRSTENNVTLVMIIVILIFMVCLAPARLVQLAWNYEYDHCSELRYYLIHLTNSLEMLNSSVNFVIYVIYHRRFRQLFCDLCCCQPLAKYCTDWQSASSTKHSRHGDHQDREGRRLTCIIMEDARTASTSMQRNIHVDNIQMQLQGDAAVINVHYDGKNGKVETRLLTNNGDNSGCSSDTLISHQLTGYVVLHQQLQDNSQLADDFGGVYVGPAATT